LTYSGEIAKFKTWISTRLAWLDANMTGSVVSIEKNPDIQVRCRVFPNPVSDILFIESDKEISCISIFNITGILVKEKKDLCDFSITTNIAGLNPGIYFIRIVFSNGEIAVTRVVKR
jgi:hypothetical protein